MDLPNLTPLMNALTCLFVGRFQPFHNGHLMVVKGMTKVCGRVVVAIGSADKHHAEKNPFTAEERKEMIQAALQDADIIPSFDVNFIVMPDLSDDAAWTDELLKRAGPVHMMWSGDEKTKACFEGRPVEVKTIKPVPGVSGTEIRRLMKEGHDWKKLVPRAVADVIVRLDGAARVRSL